MGGEACTVELNASTLPEGFTVVTFEPGADLHFEFVAQPGTRELDIDFGLDLEDEALPITGAAIEEQTRAAAFVPILGVVLVVAARLRRRSSTRPL